jgi:DNA-binding CsgD family transcriptional regulator
LRYCVTLDDPSGSVLVFRRGRRDKRHYAVTPREAAMLQRTLLGETQKEIAESEGVAPSTASNCVRSAMVKMGFRSRMEMAPFAALAMSQHHKEGEGGARIFSAHQGEVIFARAEVDWARGPRLTDCEAEIAKLILLGKSNQDIAIVRRTTVGTAQNQVACLFRKFQVSGRFEFMRAMFDAIYSGPGGMPLPSFTEQPRHLTG